MVQLDLSAEAEDFRVQLPPLTEFGSVERQLAENTWRGRMLNEHASARVFGGLLGQLMRAGVSAERQTAALRMAQDELRHAKLCAGVLVSLGAPAVGILPELQTLPEHEDAESPTEVLLRNVMSICCLSETIAVALIEAERRALGDNPLAGVLKSIVADEVQHARFGWTLFEETELDDALKARLSAYLGCALSHVEAHELANLSPVCPPNGAQQLGACDGTLAREILYETLEDVIVVGFRRFGIDAGTGWKAQGPSQISAPA